MPKQGLGQARSRWQPAFLFTHPLGKFKRLFDQVKCAEGGRSPLRKKHGVGKGAAAFAQPAMRSTHCALRCTVSCDGCFVEKYTKQNKLLHFIRSLKIRNQTTQAIPAFGSNLPMPMYAQRTIPPSLREPCTLSSADNSKCQILIEPGFPSFPHRRLCPERIPVQLPASPRSIELWHRLFS